MKGKEKRTWKRCISTMLALVLLLTMPGTVSATSKSTVSLNKSVVYLKTGETADVDIQNVNLVENNIQNIGIAFLADPKVYTETTLEKGSFLKHGISRFWPETEKKENILLETPDDLEATFNANGSYYGLVSDEESLVEIANDFAKVPGISGVSVVKMAIPSGEPPYENWNIKGTEIASLAVSGGELATGFTGSGPYLNQTARVQGLKQGVTTLTVERGGFGAYASDVCTVIVYEPGSTNNPGDLDHSGAITAEDALQALKQTVGLISLDEDSKKMADLNLDGVVNAEDALLMLKITVGIL